MPRVIKTGKIIVGGKEFDLSQFDDTRSWEKPKPKKPKNLLGKVNAGINQ